MKRCFKAAFLLFGIAAVGQMEAGATNRRMINTYHEQLVDYGRLESNSNAFYLL